MTPKHAPGPPMTLGNMRELGVHHRGCERGRKRRNGLSGCSFVLNCTNDRGEYSAACASGDHL
jgi:hypothetical protein